MYSKNPNENNREASEKEYFNEENLKTNNKENFKMNSTSEVNRATTEHSGVINKENNLNSQTKILFFRHLKKAFKNNTFTKGGCDSPLVEPTKEEILKITNFIKILLNLNFPDIIYCSPFLRTRKTAVFLRDLIEQITGKHIIIKVKNNFGEYLGNQYEKISVSSFDEITYLYDPLLEKDIGTFRKRCLKGFTDLQNTMEKSRYNTVWVISHQIVITEIIKSYIRIPKKFKIHEMDCVSYYQNRFEISQKEPFWTVIVEQDNYRPPDTIDKTKPVIVLKRNTNF